MYDFEAHGKNSIIFILQNEIVSTLKLFVYAGWQLLDWTFRENTV